MPLKIFSFILVISILICPNFKASANIIEDIKNGFQPTKSKSKDESKTIKTQAELEIDQVKIEAKNICETQKSYATKHFENRRTQRSGEIEKKLSVINKVKSILSNNKLDITSLNLTTDTIAKVSNQKIKLLSQRVDEASSIICSDMQNFDKSILSLKEINQSIGKLDKELRIDTREFSEEAQRLMIKTNKPKTV